MPASKRFIEQSGTLLPKPKNTMKSNKIDPIEIKSIPKTRVTKEFSYFRNAFAVLIVFLGYTAFALLPLLIGTLFINGTIKESARINCIDDKYQEEIKEGSIKQGRIDFCETLGVEIK